MADSRWERTWDVFHAAIERAPVDRIAFVASSCGDDRLLQSEIESLLQSHNRLGNYLEDHPQLCARNFPATPEAMIGELIDKRYRIRSVIGVGGMGVVYLSEQEWPIRRTVALKLIKSGIDSESVMARFEAERQAMADLDHPNIARIYDAGTAQDGRPYFAMEYIPGVPITEYSDTRRLSINERLKLFIQTCEGLQHAHQRGIIHRDIKPSNVLVEELDSGPNSKVIDFGVAKALNHRLNPMASLTGAGQLIGTPEYMSPEQTERGAAREIPLGSANTQIIDARSDIYSLGVLLYELLVGERPVEAGDPPTLLPTTVCPLVDSEILAPSDCLKRLGANRDKSAALRGTDANTLLRHLRGALDRIVMKALRRDRSQRYSSVSDLITDLRRYRPPNWGYIKLIRRDSPRRLVPFITIAGFLLFAVGLLLSRPAWLPEVYQRGLTPDSQLGKAQVKLAVLPFRNVGGEQEREYFSEGLTEELISRVGKISPSKLQVIGPTTAMRYKHTAKSIEMIGKELGVDYLLEGSVRQGGNRLRMTAQLVRVSDQMQLWSESYEFKLQDVIAAQTEMSLRVARSLAVEVLPSVREQLTKPAVVNAEAYDAYLKGRYFRDTVSDAGFRKSIEYFKQAIGNDPQFAPAYAGIAGCYCLLSGHGLEVDAPKTLMTAAKDMAERALALDPNLAEAHGVLGMYYLKYAWDWRSAERSLRRAIELDPNDAMIRVWFSFFLSAQARHTEALSHAKIARHLDRFSRTANVNVAFQYYDARQYDQAMQEFTNTLEMFPGFWGAYWGRGLVYTQARNKEKSLIDLKRAVELSDGNPSALGALGYGHAVFDEKNKANDILSKLLDKASRDYVPAATIMAIYGALGNIDESLVWFKKAYEQRSRAMVWIKVGHDFDPLRETALYKDILARMGLSH